jgi:hypothetical protein
MCSLGVFMGVYFVWEIIGFFQFKQVKLVKFLLKDAEEAELSKLLTLYEAHISLHW